MPIKSIPFGRSGWRMLLPVKCTLQYYPRSRWLHFIQDTLGRNKMNCGLNFAPGLGDKCTSLLFELWHFDRTVSRHLAAFRWFLIMIRTLLRRTERYGILVLTHLDCSDILEVFRTLRDFGIKCFGCGNFVECLIKS